MRMDALWGDQFINDNNGNADELANLDGKKKRETGISFILLIRAILAFIC